MCVCIKSNSQVSLCCQFCLAVELASYHQIANNKWWLQQVAATGSKWRSRLVATAPNGQTARQQPDFGRTFAFFTNRRLQLVALAIQFATRQKQQQQKEAAEEEEKQQIFWEKFNLMFLFFRFWVLTNVLQLIVPWFLFHTLKWVRSPFLVPKRCKWATSCF